MKKIYVFLFGSDENMLFNISSALLLMSIIFAAFSMIFEANNHYLFFFTYMSTFCFSAWLILPRGVDSAEKIVKGLVRFAIFFCFCFSCPILYFLYNYAYHRDGNYLVNIGCCFLLFLGSIYVVLKFRDIFNFIRTIFKKIQIKIFNVDNSTSVGIKLAIENITVFLVAVGGLFVAIKTIVIAIYQICHYIK